MTVEPAESVSVEQVNTSEALRRQALLPPTSALSILSVRWGVSIPVAAYSSVRLDAEAAVPMGGSAESTLQELKEWVRSQSPLSSSEQDAVFFETQRAENELIAANDRLAVARADYERIRKALETLGVKPTLLAVEDLPF